MHGVMPISWGGLAAGVTRRGVDRLRERWNTLRYSALGGVQASHVPRREVPVPAAGRVNIIAS